MNIGELKLQNFFNSQTQLNTNWLGSEKTKSSFDDVLKNKTAKSSDVETQSKYKGLTNRTMDHYATRDVKNERNDFNQVKELGELKQSIREGIAQKKMIKEVDANGSLQSLTKKVKDLAKLEESIESLEKEIKAELGLPEETDALEMMASLLGINVEQLILQLTSDQADMIDSDALMNELSEMLNSEEINVDMVIKELESLVELMPKDKLESFNEVLIEVLETLTEETTQMAVKPLLEQIEAKLPEVIETVVPETVVAEVSEIQTKTESVVTNDLTVKTPEAMNAEIKVEVKEEAPRQEMQSNQEEKPLMNASIKEVGSKVNTTMTYEEQVNLMKSENSLITSAKVEPQGVVARSVMSQVIQGAKMSINLADQGSEIMIKLNPKNLGNVALKMSFDKGVLLAEIQVENQTVKGIVESNLENLRNALKNEGYNIGELDVSVNKENTGQGEQTFNQNTKNQAKHETFEEIEDRLLQANLVNDTEVNYLA